MAQLLADQGKVTRTELLASMFGATGGAAADEIETYISSGLLT